LPNPVIDILLQPTEPDTQGTLDLSASDRPERQAHKHPVLPRSNRIDPSEYERVKQFLTNQHLTGSIEVQTELGIDAAHARILLKRLVEDGFAVAEGQGRATRYVVSLFAGGANANTSDPAD
jgi:hypothetical protein